jgi:hypothetical protein
MSLNAGVLDDLEDNDGITAPSAATGGGEPITIVPSSPIDPVTSELTEQELTTLPSKDVSFKLVNDGVTKVVSLKEVEQDIIGAESIDKTGFEKACISFESLADGPVSVAEFTNTPSQVNYGYVKRNVKQIIATEEANLVSNYVVFIDKPLEEACGKLGRFKDAYIPRIESLLYELKAEALDFKENIRSNKKTMMQYGNEFVNITDFNIMELDVSKIVSDNVKLAELTGYVKGIQNAMSNVAFNGYVHGMINDGNGSDTSNIGKYMGFGFTSINLTDFLLSNVQDDLDAKVRKAEESTLVLMKLQEDSKKVIGANEVTSKFISDNIDVCSKAYEDIERLSHLISSLTLLLFCGKEYMNFIKSL